MSVLRPLSNRIVVKPAPVETKTASGLYLSESAQEKPQIGEVIAVGKKVQEIKVADQVLYAKYVPTEIKIEGEELLLMSEDDVLAITG